MNQLISVIIIAYNIEDFIFEALNSCIKQDYCNYEIICIDDGSTDKTYETIINFTHSIRNKAIKIKAYKKTNGGPNSARKEGIKYAKGDYIFFMDGDDILPPTALSSLAKELYNHLYDIVFGAFQIKTTKGNNNKIFNYDIIKGSSGIKVLESYIYKPKAIWGKLFNRSLFIENNIDYLLDLKIGEDAALMTQLLYYSKKISGCNNITYIYRAHRINSLYTQYGYDSNYEHIIPSYLYISTFLKDKNIINNPKYFYYFHNIIYRYLTSKKNAKKEDDAIQIIVNNLPFNTTTNKDKITKVLYLLSKIDIKYGRIFLNIIENFILIKSKFIKTLQ